MPALSSEETAVLKHAIGLAINGRHIEEQVVSPDDIVEAINYAGFCVCKANAVVVKLCLDTTEAAAELEALAEKMRAVKNAMGEFDATAENAC